MTLHPWTPLGRRRTCEDFEYACGVGTVFFVVLFVVLVNGGCMLSFNRAQKALRDLGAAWVRALSMARPNEDTPTEEEPPGPVTRIRVPHVAMPRLHTLPRVRPARG